MTEEGDRQPTAQDILKNVRVGKNLTVGNITQTIIQRTEREQPARSRSETLLLQAVKQEVISRLDQSLHNAVFINLGKQPQPQQVKRPWDAEIKIGSNSPEPLPAETTILEVFDRAGIDGRLLILGEPGAGKTTTMLDLAKGLCDRAEQDATAFIPVLLNLSSWKDSKQKMTAWLVEELKSKYGSEKTKWKQWIKNRQLLPLLDGLDELKPEHQVPCVQAINCWLEREDRPLSLVVCCRREEYETVVQGQWQEETAEPQDETRIHLNGAILLQPLTDEQIQTYLTAANQPELWQMLRQDEALWEIIRTPLWLSITLLSYEGVSLKKWQQATSTKQRLALLLDTYIQRMLHRELSSRIDEKYESPNAQQTRRWLTYLAQQLQRESRTEFLIENIQPTWLATSAQKQQYSLFVGVIVGIPVGLVMMTLDIGAGFIVGVILGILYSQIKRVKPFEFEILYSPTSAFEALPKEVEKLGSNIGDFFLESTKLGYQRIGRGLFGLIGLIWYILLSLKNEIEWILLKSSASRRLTIREWLQLLYCLSCWLPPIYYLAVGTFHNLITYPSSSFILYQNLIFTIFLCLLLLLLMPIIIGTWVVALGIFLIVGLLVIQIDLLFSNSGTPIMRQTPRKANQGICHSFWSALFIFFFTFVSIILSSAVNLLCKSYSVGELTYDEIDSIVIILGVKLGALLGLILCLRCGGLAVIQHITLRHILYRDDHIPWNYARFLDYCTERLLLQRVGGRYRFIHKSLQEHFAAMGSGE